MFPGAVERVGDVSNRLRARSKPGVAAIRTPKLSFNKPGKRLLSTSAGRRRGDGPAATNSNTLIINILGRKTCGRNTLAISAACAAVTICGQAQAQQPAATPAAPAAVPDQMPFDIPYGNTITADRAADVVKAVVAEATNLPNWKLAISVVDTHGELVYFYKMDNTQHWIGDDLAEQGADGGAPAPPDADLQYRDANSCRRLHRDARFAPADGISRRDLADRGWQDHRCGRLQRRHGRSGRRRLQGRCGYGEVVRGIVGWAKPTGARSAPRDERNCARTVTDKLRVPTIHWLCG